MTVLELIADDWHAAGHTGDPPREYVRRWREENPVYGRCPLGTRFRSGSLLPIRPLTALDYATSAWQRLHPGTEFPVNGDAEFEALIAASP